MKQTTKGIFIQRINYSESSLIVILYTELFGLQSFLFQGGRKKSQALHPLSLVECTFYKRPDSELAKLTEASSLYPLPEITDNPIKSAIAFFMCDVIKNCFQQGSPETKAFEFLEAQINLLNNTTNYTLFPIEFLIRLSQFIGISPFSGNEKMSYFYLEEGEFSNEMRYSLTREEGQHVYLLQEIYFLENPTSVNLSTRRKTLDTLINYFQMHMPVFKIQQSLEIIKAILYD